MAENYLTKTFILPLSGININKLKTLKGVYYDDEEVQLLVPNNNIFLLIENKEESNTLLTEPNVESVYFKKIDNKPYYMVIVKIPEKYNEDFEKFKDGKYSKFNVDTQKFLLNYYKKSNIKLYDLLTKIFNRDKTIHEETAKQFAVKLEDGRYIKDKELEKFIMEEGEVLEKPTNEIFRYKPE